MCEYVSMWHPYYHLCVDIRAQPQPSFLPFHFDKGLYNCITERLVLGLLGILLSLPMTWSGHGFWRCELTWSHLHTETLSSELFRKTPFFIFVYLKIQLINWSSFGSECIVNMIVNPNSQVQYQRQEKMIIEVYENLWLNSIAWISGKSETQNRYHFKWVHTYWLHISKF